MPKILPDTFHMNIEERNIVETLAEFGEYVGALHCADSNRLAPGMGHIDFDSVLGIAKRLPNLRYLGVEVLPLPDSDECARCAIDTIRGPGDAWERLKTAASPSEDVHRQGRER